MFTFSPSFRASHSGDSRLRKRNTQEEPSYRLLYKDEKHSNLSWLGFDILPEDEKFRHLQVLLQDSNWLWIAAHQSTNYVRELLRAEPSNSGSVKEPLTIPRLGGSGSKWTDFLEVPEHESNPNLPFPSIPEVASFEEGVLTFCSKLGAIPASEWSASELADLLEIEKIASDQFDLMTLAVGTVRALLYEGRHLVHVCYEFVKSMEYDECQDMLTYDNLISKMIKEGKKGKDKKHKQSSYDVKEKEIEDVDDEYYGSVYLDIVKDLPVLTNNLSLQLTLQLSFSFSDAVVDEYIFPFYFREVEAVFSDSSVRLLAF